MHCKCREDAFHAHILMFHTRTAFALYFNLVAKTSVAVFKVFKDIISLETFLTKFPKQFVGQCLVYFNKPSNATQHHLPLSDGAESVEHFKTLSKFYKTDALYKMIRCHIIFIALPSEHQDLKAHWKMAVF